MFVKIESFFKRPFSFYSASDYFWMKANTFTPLDNGQCFIIKSNSMIISLIYKLFGWQSPFAIFSKVTKIIINSFKPMFFGWPWSHSKIKRFKRFSPFHANFNPPTPIIFKGFIFWIIASLKHMFPGNIFRSIYHSMFFRSFTGGFTIIASTAFNNAMNKIPSTSYKRLISTIALTYPGIIFTSYDKQTIELFSFNIYKSTHGKIISFV